MPSRQMKVVPREVPPELTLRAGVSAAVVCLAFALVAARLWYLQLALGTEMRDWSERNRIRLVRVPAGRGVVYDRHGEILVDNRPSFDIVFVPEDTKDRRQVLRNLAGYLGDEEAALVQTARAPNMQRQRYEGIVL